MSVSSFVFADQVYPALTCGENEPRWSDPMTNVLACVAQVPLLAGREPEILGNGEASPVSPEDLKLPAQDHVPDAARAPALAERLRGCAVQELVDLGGGGARGDALDRRVRLG